MSRKTPNPTLQPTAGRDSVRQVRGVELLYALKPLLPPAYRASIGTSPTFAIVGPEVGGPRAAVPLLADDSVAVDLDGTYRRATEAAYLA